MDGPRPFQELSDAETISQVLKFLPSGTDERVFAVDEILDPTGTSLTTVVRSRTEHDVHDQRLLREQEDWVELFRDQSPASPMTRNEDTNNKVSAASSKVIELQSHQNLIAPSKLLLVMFPPEAEVPSESTTSKRRSSYDQAVALAANGLDGATTAKKTAIRRLHGIFRDAVTAVASVLAGSPKKEPTREEEREKTASSSGKDHGPPISVPHSDHKQRLRNVPFTSSLFRAIARRMSIHSWIIRLISRANVPAFERTLTEMPLYSKSGENLGPQKAILYHCRTSNESEGDMALSVTHFPAQKLTFALFFGPSRAQQKRILTRLRRAGTDTAHPMLLPGILAELERGRQMEAVDEIINELEEQLTRIGQETVSSWQLSSQTKAERNRQKTEAWLNATFSKNILLANVSLLCSMHRHLNEFRVTVNPASARRQQHPRHYDPDHPEYRDWQPTASQSLGSTVYNFEVHATIGTEYLTGQEMLTAEPDSIHDPETKYQDVLQQASMRMEDRITSIIGEYDDKIRQCTMEVDGMAMATQWSHGETNMEIATASGEDSSQMRSIALVTMVFLPGTFFASMFSMTFFNWSSDSGGDHTVVSSSIWIYVVITVVFTLVTLLLFWYFILSRQRSRRIRKQHISVV